ncbi:hypothetical protein [Gemmata obscuriglobus]|uniref:hypothetical protein n=1 Tax=Gemmata obscuriglobus TaxID=114 RepID=UPI00016C58AC|nr:hypothetical protein [Gemmata obscuriglobus]
MAGTGEDKLSARQELAIVALLGSSTVKGAAEQAKVSEASLFKWLKDPAFKQRLSYVRKIVTDQAFTAVGTDLQEIGRNAVATIKRNLGPPAPPAVQVRAATVALDKLANWQMVADLQEQIEGLKAQLAGQAHGEHREPPGAGGEAAGASGGADAVRVAGDAGAAAGGPDAPVHGDGVAAGPVAGPVPDEPGEAGVAPLFPPGG